jgi:hypothetical protein
MLARKAVASHGVRQWPPLRMDIPANREDPPASIAVHGESETSWNPPPQFRDAWRFSLDLRHFRRGMAAVELESIEMSETRAGKP